MDFVILKVNGQDLSSSTHDEAVEAFRAAKEPIVVEVLRRVNKNKMKTMCPAMVSVATQTEEDIYNVMFPYYRLPTPPSPGIYEFANNGFNQPTSRRPVAFSPTTEFGLTDIEMANTADFDETDPYFDDRTFDVEYEEVTLHRVTDSKLGLTLCYGSTDDEVTDIFISEIEPFSAAAEDGRIREGDQILQINGVDVHSREQAIHLFSHPSLDITLLLARPQMQMDDGFIEEQNYVLDEQHLAFLRHHNAPLTAAMLLHERIDEEEGTTDTATTENSHKHEKDSGVGRTDESTKNDESSEQEMMDNESPVSSNVPTYKSERNSTEVRKCNNDSLTLNDPNNISTAKCNNKLCEVLETRFSIVEDADVLPYIGHLRQNSENSIDRELALLNKEMEEIQLECQEIVEAHMREQQKIQGKHDSDSSGKGSELTKSPRVVPRMGTRMEFLKQIQAQAHENLRQKIQQQQLERLARENTGTLSRTGSLSQHGSPSHTLLPLSGTSSHNTSNEKDTSTTSAYNTGESCRSTPLTLELNQVCDIGKDGYKGSLLCLPSAMLPPHTNVLSALDNQLYSSDTEKQTQTVLTPRADSNDSFAIYVNNNNKHVELHNIEEGSSPGSSANNLKGYDTMGESLQDIYARYADVMYTNEANLQHTIAIQQKLFQQQISQKGNKLRYRKSDESGGAQNSPSSHTLQSQANVSQGGESSAQMEWVVKRRPDGTRYITRRPIRNRMLKERAKKISEERSGMTTDDDAMSELKVGRYWTKEERKRHMEKARDQKKRKETLMKQKMETVKEGEDKNLNIVELSHRKMLKHKGKKVLDNFVTIQEMLAHGSRVQTGKTYNPLLSVTTV